MCWDVIRVVRFVSGFGFGALFVGFSPYVCRQGGDGVEGPCVVVGG